MTLPNLPGSSAITPAAASPATPTPLALPEPARPTASAAPSSAKIVPMFACKNSIIFSSP